MMPRTRCSLLAARLLLLPLPVLAACQGRADRYSGPYAKEVNDALPKIEAATGLTYKTVPKVETKTKDEVRRFLEQKFDESQPALEMAGMERAYKLFGLLPDSMDLRKYMLGLLAEQVVGYYDPATKVLYVVGGGAGAKDAPAPAMVSVTITHELVHALQDQYLGLDSISKLHGDNDRQSAAQAVVEGQATFEQLSVMLGGGNFAMNLPGGWGRVRDMIREGQASMPVFASAPMLIQETLLFPYLSGAEFVKQFKEKRPGTALYRSMPRSTEQVLHPERLLDTADVPLRLALPAPLGGRTIYENDLGEFETRLLLYAWLKDTNIASRGAKGWGGDRYVAVNTPQGPGLSWLSVWDSPLEAAEFRDLMEQVIEKRFDVKHGSGGTGETRRFSAKGRTIVLTSAMVGGYAAVLFTDVPAGATTTIIDLGRVKVTKE